MCPEEFLHIVRTLRVTIHEFNAINDACAALDLPRATLIQEAVTDAAHRMGLFAGLELPIRPRRLKWNDAPERGEVSASERFAVSFSPETYDLLQRSAKALGVSETIFAVGSSLRYIATLKRKHAKIAKLQSVALAAKYS